MFDLVQYFQSKLILAQQLTQIQILSVLNVKLDYLMVNAFRYEDLVFVNNKLIRVKYLKLLVLGMNYKNRKFCILMSKFYELRGAE